uniref:Alpha-macroglobulin receptor-binding domain-containing protein n=1 Tax=Scleropages formosus TaxID=113540 RepID=A0A8C9S3Q6_SCLFO
MRLGGPSDSSRSSQQASGTPGSRQLRSDSPAELPLSGRWLHASQMGGRTPPEIALGTGKLRKGFLVTFPAVIPADSQAKVCASLLYPNETLHMSIFLKLGDHATLLLEKKTNEAFYQCFHFQAPAVEKESIQSIRVEVRGESFQMMKDSSVMFKPYSEITFIQTDKPVYKPGQTVHFRIVTLDTQFAPVIQLVSLFSCLLVQDVHQNRIGQWTNVSTNGRILQLSHPLSSEAPLGTYTLSAAVGETRTQHSFKVKEYVLPRFEVKVNAPSEVNVAESELKIEVCGKYTYGQAVPGKAELELCRNKPRVSINERPCHTQSVQVRRTLICNSGVIWLLINSEVASLCAGYVLTGVILQESAKVHINYTIGRVKFVETPSFYDPGSNIEGKSSGFKGQQMYSKLALALFSTLAHTSEGSSTVTVQSTSGEQHRFLVDQGNRLLYQERALKDVTGQYSIAVQGTSCASVQVRTTLRYNIPTPAVNSTFSVAKVTPANFVFLHSRYNGLLESTNMVLVDIKVLSGFVPDPLSLTQLKRSELVERVDSKGDHIEMYLKELTRNIPKFYKLQLQQELKVKNLKAAVIKMYDYYQPSDYVLTEYSSPCADRMLSL